MSCPSETKKAVLKIFLSSYKRLKKTFDTKLEKIFIYLHVPKQKNIDQTNETSICQTLLLHSIAYHNHTETKICTTVNSPCRYYTCRVWVFTADAVEDKDFTSMSHLYNHLFCVWIIMPFKREELIIIITVWSYSKVCISFLVVGLLLVPGVPTRYRTLEVR